MQMNIQKFTEAAENGLAYGGWPGNGAAYVEARFDRYSDYTWQEGAYDTDWEKIALVDGYTRDADISMSGEVKKQTIIFQCPITIQKASLEVMNNKD